MAKAKLVHYYDTISSIEARHKVVLAVVALNQVSADMIVWRLIKGSSATENPLMMYTFVQVAKPDVF